MDCQNACQQILDHFEITLRKFISAKLSHHYGDSWWKTQVPGGVINECNTRLKKDELKKLPRIPIGELIDYAHIGELKDIIVRKDNYNTVFKDYFGTEPKGIEVKLNDIVRMRDPVRHVRPGVGTKEYERLAVICRDIYEEIGEDIPPLLEFKRPSSKSPAETGIEDIEEIEESEQRKLPPCYDNLPRPEYSKFFGREKEKKQVLEYLNHPRAWVVCIDGIGGVGKTALALNCAYQLRDLAHSGDTIFEYIIWVSAKKELLGTRGIRYITPTFSDLNSLLNIILKTTGFSEKVNASLSVRKELVDEILSITPCLLILDNLETIENPNIFTFLADLPKPSKALVTTRSRIEESQRTVRLTALHYEEAKNLLTETAEDLDAKEIISAKNDIIKRMINRVGGIPLAIKLAVGRIASGVSLESYLAKLETGLAQDDILDFCFSESWQGFDSEEQKVLMSITIFSNPPSEEEIRRNTSLPELRVKDALAKLRRNAFINEEYDSSRTTFRYSLLPLTGDFVSRKLKEEPVLEEELRDSHKVYLAELGEYEEALSQMQELVSKELLPEKDRISNMLVDVAFRAYQSGNYKKAIDRLEKAESYKATANLYQVWGLVERDEGAFGSAKEKFKKALSLDDKHISAWRSWGNMEKRLKNYSQAVECYEMAVYCDESDAKDHHFLGVCLSYLAKNKRDLREKRRMIEKSVEALSNGFYPNPIGYRERHHNVVNGHSLALALIRIGRKADALLQCQNGLKIEPDNERLLRLEKELR